MLLDTVEAHMQLLQNLQELLGAQSRLHQMIESNRFKQVLRSLDLFHKRPNYLPLL